MSVQNVSQLPQLSFQASASSLLLPFATRALFSALSARAETIGLRAPSSSVTRFNATTNNRIASLQIESQRAAGTQAILQGANATLGLIDDKLSTLQTLTASAVGASAGQRATLNSAAQTLIQDIVGAANQFVSKNPQAVIKAKPGDPQASATNQVFKNVRILNSSVEIPDAGLSFTFDITNNVGPTFNRSGDRGVIANGIVDLGTIGILDGDVSFILAGNKGSFQFDFAAGTASADVLAAINAQSENTGVQAFIDAGDDFDFFATEFGNDGFVQIIELLDLGVNEIRPNANVGANAQALITDNQTGESITVEATGRRFSFSLSGLDFEVDLFEEINPATGAALLAENNNRPARLIKVEGSGLKLNDAGSTRLSLPELEIGNLTRTGLLTLDLVNDPAAALTVVDGIRTELASPLARVSSALATVSTDLVRKAETIASLEQNRSDVVDLDSLIKSFDRIRNEAREQAGFALLSQISSLFPNSVLPLVGITS